MATLVPGMDQPLGSTWRPGADGGSTCDISLGDRHLSVHIDDVHLVVGLPGVQRWVATSARALIGVYGRFPVPAADITIHVDREEGAHHGVTYGGRFITIDLGVATTAEDLVQDWVLTHEMVHLAFPGLDDAHIWMEEGLATYLEPLARTRIDALPPDEVWLGMLQGLPKGLPLVDDAGLDHTHTWGRTYWGGCLFWFLADVKIRAASGNAHSVDDLLRALNVAGWDGRTTIRMDALCQRADTIFGNQIFSQLERRMATEPVTIDVGALFHDLGIAMHQGRIAYDDAAPSAGVRMALTRRFPESVARPTPP